MSRYLSVEMHDDVMKSVEAAEKRGIVDFTSLANAAIMRHGAKGVTRQVLEELILNLALRGGRAVEFSGVAEGSVVPEGYTMVEIEIIQETVTVM